MFKRILALMMVGAFLATIAIGCGGKKDDDEKKVKDAAKDAKEEVEKKGSDTK